MSANWTSELRGKITRPKSMSIKTSQTEFQREKNLKKRKKKGDEQNIRTLCGNFKNCDMHTIRNTRRSKREGAERTREVAMAENFPKLMADTKHRSRKLREHQAG